MRRGENVRFNVRNRLDEDATLHWHGFELPASADGGPHQVIRPGEIWRPAFEVRQRASLYWYHSHMHRRSGPQVYAGLAAPIYVRDDEEDRFDLPNEYGVDDIPLLVQDRIVGEDGALIYPSGMRARMMGRGNDGGGSGQVFRILDIRPARSAQTALLPAQLATFTSPDPSVAVRTRRFVLDMGMMGGGMSINGAAMDMDVINERVPVGQWEIWEIVNASMMAHPFHIHNVQFRVIDRDGKLPPPLVTGFKDTVIVNPREQVRLLLRFEEYTDPDMPYMYHCHILEHEDAGMMGQFVVSQ